MEYSPDGIKLAGEVFNAVDIVIGGPVSFKTEFTVMVLTIFTTALYSTANIVVRLTNW